MRCIRRSALLWTFLALTPLGGWAQDTRQNSISGRLILNQTGVSCERIQVELERVEMQPIVFADSSCNFRFTQVKSGSYIVHVNVEGFAEVRQPVEFFDSRTPNSPLLIQMERASVRVVQKPAGNEHLVDVTEILDQHPRKAVSLYQKSLESRKKKKDADAIRQLEEAIEIAPNFYQAHNDLGVLYRRAGRTDDAEAQFIRAHDINQNSAEPLINLSVLYLEENKPERAAEVSQEAVKANSRSASGFFNLGLALYKLSNLDKAEAALKRALELAPKMFKVHLALANVYMKLRRFDRLVDQLNTYLAKNPSAEDREQVERLRDQVLKGSGDGR